MLNLSFTTKNNWLKSNKINFNNKFKYLLNVRYKKLKGTTSIIFLKILKIYLII